MSLSVLHSWGNGDLQSLSALPTYLSLRDRTVTQSKAQIFNSSYFNGWKNIFAFNAFFENNTEYFISYAGVLIRFLIIG